LNLPMNVQRVAIDILYNLHWDQTTLSATLPEHSLAANLPLEIHS
jgi:hypothetical protein